MTTKIKMMIMITMKSVEGHRAFELKVPTRCAQVARFGVTAAHTVTTVGVTLAPGSSVRSSSVSSWSTLLCNLYTSILVLGSHSHARNQTGHSFTLSRCLLFRRHFRLRCSSGGVDSSYSFEVTNSEDSAHRRST